MKFCTRKWSVKYSIGSLIYKTLGGGIGKEIKHTIFNVQLIQKLMHNLLSIIYRSSTTQVTPLQILDSKESLRAQNDILVRWQEHFNKLKLMMSLTWFPAVPPQSIRQKFPPSLEKVKTCLKNPNSGNLLGMDGIHAEILKCRSEDLVPLITDPIQKIWIEECIRWLERWIDGCSL